MLTPEEVSGVQLVQSTEGETLITDVRFWVRPGVNIEEKMLHSRIDGQHRYHAITSMKRH